MVTAPAPLLSVVAPARDEERSVPVLVERLAASLDEAGIAVELLVVDDASTDETLAVLEKLQAAESRLRILRLAPDPKRGGNGQSAALAAGIRASRGALVATIDADLQNDPRDLPALLRVLRASGADLVQGDRSRVRRDPFRRRLTSTGAFWVRRLILRDHVRDNGCTLRLMRRSVAAALPLDFRGLHRFIPTLAIDLGFRVVETPVQHDPRRHGRSKYRTLDRILAAVPDCLAIHWMRRRRHRPGCREVRPAARERAGVRPAESAVEIEVARRSGPARPSGTTQKP